MAEFIYNNMKKLSTSHILLELNYDYNLYVFYEKNIDLRFESKLAEELLSKFYDLMTHCWKNLYYAQVLEKRLQIKYAKSRNYVLVNKVLLNSKYIKNIEKQKFEAKFFGLFQVLYSIRIQV